MVYELRALKYMIISDVNSYDFSCLLANCQILQQCNFYVNINCIQTTINKITYQLNKSNIFFCDFVVVVIDTLTTAYIDDVGVI